MASSLDARGVEGEQQHDKEGYGLVKSELPVALSSNG